MILSIDQGTTGTTVLVLSPEGEILGRGYSEFRADFSAARMGVARCVGDLEDHGEGHWDGHKRCRYFSIKY